jgi:molybdopterin-biosynthesis enzyme MoeA-like protein
LLSEKDVTRHRVLTQFVKTTGFTLTDAKILEDKEPSLSEELLKRIENYRPITSAGTLFERNAGWYLTSIIGNVF